MDGFEWWIFFMKIRIFLWKIGFGFILVWEVSEKRGMKVKVNCFLCKDNLESISYLFNECKVIKVVRDDVKVF